MKTDFYFEFENRFRGTPQEIKSRLSSYDGLINYILNNIDSPKFLDIGSGRGEWLEKCKEMNIEAMGIENNPQMVSFCEDKGLKIVSGNALDSIEKFETDHFSIITAFHLIEHLSPNDVYKMLKQCRRVLKAEGILILETPSIDNLQVSSRTFYLDPTHINPINPDGMIFDLEQSGFSEARYYYINGDDPIEFDGNNLAKIISGSARDVCFIASKLESKNINIFNQEKFWLNTFNLSQSTMEIVNIYDSNYKQKEIKIDEQASRISSLEKHIDYITYRQDKIYNNVILRLYRKVKSFIKKIFDFIKFLVKNNIYFIFTFLLKNISSKLSFFLLRVVYKLLKIMKLNSFSSKFLNTILKTNKAMKKSHTSNNKLEDLYNSSHIAQKIYKQIKSK